MTAQDPYSLIGKAAIVVGSANGIGRAIALELARAGAGIACVDLDEPGTRDTVGAITLGMRVAPPSVSTVTCR